MPAMPGRIVRIVLLSPLLLGAALISHVPATCAEETNLGEVVVTATRTAKPVEETPVASYVVTAADIERRNVKTIDEAISLIPGVFQRCGKGYIDTLSEISLCGVPGGKRSLIMIDGLPVNDAYDNSAKLGGFSPDDLSHVEVALGPGSSLYGSSAAVTALAGQQDRWLQAAATGLPAPAAPTMANVAKAATTGTLSAAQTPPSAPAVDSPGAPASTSPPEVTGVQMEEVKRTAETPARPVENRWTGMFFVLAMACGGYWRRMSNQRNRIGV